ncbi:PREDICTED: H/ACA ribonucleoprotein complex non-core subunit NAF1 [Populus euphratica]|uniref:H/ACA ribonucleoprotein complex non-core subunit NAF1 n=1 Tax=Populus euphratica TaxID=75702 RepID=A0AAJ6V1C1_POPEU|nr:PREDICTED: H/ACA ribonucleoprotein complex non-core subunit NAF1 [Populus euphratica]
MVGFVFEPSTTEEENNQVSKARNSKDPIQPFDQKLTNFADYFLDFDSIEEFFGDPEGVSLDFEKRMQVEDKRFVVKDLTVDGSDLVFEEKKGIVDGSDLEGLMKVKGERVELERGGSLECSIEEEMGRVSLVAVSSLVVADGGGKVVGEDAEIDNGGLINGSGSDIGNGIVVNGKVVNDEDERESESSESESESESIESSSSSDDDGEEDSEEEKQEEREVREVVNKELDDLGDMEEGEIRNVNGEEMVGRDDTDVEVFEEEDGDKMVEWSDFDEDEDAVNEGYPIRSKNELKFLPPVPPVVASLEPHHQMQAVGAVLSAIGSQVIVEGVEKHNPLNEGSILWITEKRSPLGLIDEIFGPVKNPYYVVRYNSESEVPGGIHNGTVISFVPEFANHVLNDKNLYKKGYDASGEYDEELTKEAEFSDDEEEAEYKRMLKMSKRGIDCETVGKKKNNRRKVKNRGGGWKSNKPSGEQIPTGVDQLSPHQNLFNLINESSVGTSFAPGPQTTGVFTPNGVWVNEGPPHQPVTLAIPGGFPANNMPWAARSQLQHPYHIPKAIGMPIQPQFNPCQGPLPNAFFPGGHPNFFAGPTYPPSWPAVGGQNYFNQAAFGTGFQVQPNPQAMNTIEQGMMSRGLPLEQNCSFQSPAIPPGNIKAPQQFNMGASSSHGRKPYRRGGGRFSGGRGRQPSN